MNSKGNVFWITGLSGSGKSSIAIRLTHRLRTHGLSVIYLDGDVLRDIFQDNFGHSEAERLRASQTYARLCAMLSAQGVTVVCSTISLFHETQQWCRENIERYCEVFVRVPIDVLLRRDSKGIYSKAKAGEITNVVGFDINPQFPISPEIVIDNYGDITPDYAVEIIWDFLNKEKKYAFSC